MSPALADNALRLFLIILALLLAVSVLEVLRHPPEEAAPADEGGPSLYDEAPAVLLPPPPQGRHAAPPAAGTWPGAGTGPLPVRSPGQSGWTSPTVSGRAFPPGPPDADGPPLGTGGPPWGPAPKPPDLEQYHRHARHRTGPR